MSSVQGSTNTKNRYEETIRRQREEYQKKESELVRKHNKELRNVNENYQAEIDRIKLDQKEQNAEFSRRARKALTTKDNHYKNQISKLKQLHSQQYSKMKEEAANQLTLTREVNKQRENMQQRSSDNRLATLKDHYNEVLKNTEDLNNQRLNTVRDEQKEALKTQRKRMSEAQEEQVSTLAKMHQEQTADKQRAYDDLRQSAMLRQKAQDIRHLSDKQRISQNHMEQINRRDIEFNEQSELRRKAYSENIDKLREDYNSQEKINERKRELAMQSLDQTTSKRISETVQRLKNQIESLKAENIRNQVREKWIADKHVNSLRNEFQKNVENLQDQKSMIAEEFKDERDRENHRLQSDFSRQIGEATKFYQRKIDVDNFKAKEAIQNINVDFNARQEQVKQQADLRVDNIRNASDRQMQVQQRHFEDSREFLQQANEKEKLDLQLELTQQKNDAVARANDRIRKIEIEQAAKLQQMKQQYDGELAQLHDRQTKEKAAMRAKNKNGVESLQKLHKTELEATKTRYEQKLSESQFSHDREIERLNRRHEEQINDLLASFRKA